MLEGNSEIIQLNYPWKLREAKRLSRATQLICITTRSRILDGTTYGLPQSLNCSLQIDKSVSSVTQFCPNFYDPMDCSIPGFPVHHQLPEFIQTHVHRVGDAIQPSHPLLSSSTPTFNFPRISSVQFSCSVVSDSATPWIAARQASLSITNSRSSLRHTSIELVMPCSYLILCRPLLLLPPIPHSIRVFSNESVLCIRWPKYWSFSFSISPSNKYSGLISFRIEWFALLTVQGTLKSLLQHHSSKTSILHTQLSLQSNSCIHAWLLEKP